MKTSIFITIFSLLSFVSAPLTFADIIPVGVIMPGSSIKIYESFAGPTIVTITVSDYAPGGNSKLIKMIQDPNIISSPREITEISATSTSTVTIPLSMHLPGAGVVGPLPMPLPPGFTTGLIPREHVVLECNGTSGYCMYKIENVERVVSSFGSIPAPGGVGVAPGVPGFSP